VKGNTSHTHTHTVIKSAKGNLKIPSAVYLNPKVNLNKKHETNMI